MDSSIEVESKTKSYKILIILVIILVVGILGFIGFYLYKIYNNPRKVFIESVSKFYGLEKVDDILKEDLNTPGYTYLIDGSASSKYNDEDLFKIDLDSRIVCDVELNKCYYDINTLNNNNPLLSLEGLYVEQIYYLDMSEVAIENIDDEILYQTINKIIETLKEYLTEDKFISSNEVISVDNKDTKVRKISISFTEKDLSDIGTNLYTKIYNDEELLKKIATEDLTIDDIKNNIQDLIKELSSYNSNNNVITYDIYLKNRNILKQEFKYEDITIIMDSDNEDKYDLTIKNKEELIGTGYITEDTIELDINYNDSKMNIIYSISKDNQNKGNIKVTSTAYGSEFVIDLNYEIKDDFQLPKLDVSNAKSFEDITDEEQNKIIEGLFSQIFPGLNGLENLNFS